MSERDRVRVEIGFDGGQIAGAFVAHGSADELERRLTEGGEETIALAAEEGTLLVRLSKVAYVKRFAREGRVGFGA